MHSYLAAWHMAHKRIFVRADLNVPMENGTITDDYRLLAIEPTLKFIINLGGTIILATHLGRPEGQEKELSTKHLVPWFTRRGYDISFAPTFQDSHELTTSIILLENLRFFPGEQDHSLTFAQELATLADYYVNDAFALMHKDDTSITLLPEQFSPDKRTFGLLVAKELAILDKLIDVDAHPYLALLGGGKISKIKDIPSFLEHVDTLCIGPALSTMFLKAQGKSVGISKVDDTLVPLCTTIVQQAHAHKKLLLPIDYQITLKSFDGPMAIVDADAIPHDALIVSIGPKTTTQWIDIIRSAALCFFNGAMGFQEYPESLEATHHILQAMAESKGLTIIGGGSTVGIARDLGITDHISYCSTGGGATLAYLSGKKLPGLVALGIQQY